MDADHAIDFADFVQARWSALFGLAFLLTASTTAAEDLLQGSLEKCYCRWDKVGRMEAPEAYVRKVMVNSLVSSRRRLAWRREVLRADPPALAAESGEHGILDHALLWPLVCALPERQRAAVVLRYYEDLTERETADVLGCAVGTVKSQVADAMRALRRGIAAAEVQETAVLER